MFLVPPPVYTRSLCVCRYGLRKKARMFAVLCVHVSPSAGRRPDVKHVCEINCALLLPPRPPG